MTRLINATKTGSISIEKTDGVIYVPIAKGHIQSSLVCIRMLRMLPIVHTYSSILIALPSYNISYLGVCSGWIYRKCNWLIQGRGIKKG